MLVSIALTEATVFSLHKTSRRNAMARAPRQNQDEMLVRLETFSRPRRLDRDHIPDKNARCPVLSAFKLF